MNLSVWDPLREMEALLDRYGRPSKKALTKNDEKTFEVGDWMPVVDIYETDDVQVHIENGILTIRGEKKTELEDKKQHRIECSYGAFVRSFTLPQSIKTGEIEAEYKEGILNLTLPKSEEAKPNQIEVKIK